MDQGLIPKRYAKAIFEAAGNAQAQLNLYDQMKQLLQSFADEPSLQSTLSNPFVSDADKEVLIGTAAHTTASDAQWANILRVLKENGRLGMVRDIALAYVQLYRRANNIYKVEVVAAAPLAPAEQERLKKLVLSHLGGGSMEYSMRVDPDLIGGFAVTVDNQRLDASVKNELKQLRLKLLSNKKA